MSEFRRARFGLTLRYAAVTTGLVAALSALLWVLVISWEVADRDEALLREAEWLQGFMREAPPDAEVREELSEVGVATEERAGLLIVASDGRLGLRQGLLADTSVRDVGAVIHAPGHPVPVRFETGRPGRALAVPSSGGSTLVLACGLDNLSALRLRLLGALALAVAATLVLGPMLGWLYAGAVLRPVQRSYEGMREFLADASHEMRTPLTAIIGEAEVTLRRERAEEEYRRAIQYCADYARQMSRVVEDVLALSRADAAIPILEAAPLDLSALAREEAEAAARLTGAVEVVYDGPSEPLEILGDARLLRRAIRNLLDNALQHAVGARRIEVTVSRDPGSDHVLVTVRDDGAGIAQEHLARVFERFYRAGPTGAGAEGAGLGLAIVDAVAKAHGGGADLRTEAGPGCAFTLRLPAGLQ